MTAMWRHWQSNCNMGKYFFLQLKRVARFLPYGLCVVIVLFGCMGLVYRAMVLSEETENAAENVKLQVAIVGAAGDRYLQWGLAAMQFDSSAMSLKLVMMEEETAIEALKTGQITAYVVFPEGFMDSALHGDVQQLRFVSTAGTQDLATIIKEEVTAVVDRVLIACESGSYGVGDALTDNGLGDSWGKHVNGMSLEYVDFLFDRSRIYRVDPLAQKNHLTIAQYMPGALATMLLMLSCLAFAPLYVRPDQAMARLLRSQRIGIARQVIAELASYGVGLMALLAVVAAILAKSGMVAVSGWSVFVGMLPGLWMFAALTYLLYSMADQLIGGVLGAFFVTLALCFVGGCMYPIRMFPDSIQSLSAILPSGIARTHITACFLGMASSESWKLMAYAMVFAALSVVIRSGKAGKVRG